MSESSEIVESATNVLSLEQVRHIAKLARLRLTEYQLDCYRTQLSSVLRYIEKLKELDIPDINLAMNRTSTANRLDEDEVRDAMPIEHLLRNAPAVEDRYLAVPKVLGDESA